MYNSQSQMVSAQPGLPQAPPELHMIFETLAKEVEELRALTIQLSGRLEPVIRQSPQAERAGQCSSANSTSAVPFVRALEGVVENTRQTRDEVIYLLGNLAL